MIERVVGHGVKCLVSILLVITGAAVAAVESAPEPGASRTLLDPAELAAFVDGFVTARMKAHHAAGVTVSVVHDGAMQFARGYGDADRDAGRPVIAEETLFRPGSISKTFTWTAVMQLVEQERLDLHADIRSYLPGLEIPATFAEPITLAHLMAHTPGFEESLMGHLFVDDPDRVLPLLDYLQTRQPARVRPPGVLPAYSNYGSGLAGLIVANVSGMPWEAYAERHLFEPLGMTRTTFREPWGTLRPDRPMAPELQAAVSRGYQHRAGAFVPGGFEFVGHIGPAGALSTTATDMARWMLAHLGGGELDGARILGAEAARAMHHQHYTPAPGMPGNAHGFIESTLGGYRAIGHGGGTVHFISDLQLVPELGLGVFISTNTAGTGALVTLDFAEALVKRFFPSPDPDPGAPATAASAPAQLAEYTGSYLATRRAHTTVERLLNTPVVSVQATPDGALLLSTPLGPVRLLPEGPDTFRGEESGQPARFVRDGSGAIAYLAAGMPILVLEPVHGLANPRNLHLLLGLSAFILACVPIGAWLRRRRPPPQTAIERTAGALAVITALVWIGAFGAGVIGIAVPLSADPGNIFYAFPSPLFRVALGIALVAALLSVLSLLLLVPVWRIGNWPRWRRIRHTGVVAAALVTLLVLHDLNAMGFNFIG